MGLNVFGSKCTNFKEKVGDPSQWKIFSVCLQHISFQRYSHFSRFMKRKPLNSERKFSNLTHLWQSLVDSRSVTSVSTRWQWSWPLVKMGHKISAVCWAKVRKILGECRGSFVLKMIFPFIYSFFPSEEIRALCRRRATRIKQFLDPTF